MKLNLSIAQRLTLTFTTLIFFVITASGIGLWYAFSITRVVSATQDGVEQMEQAASLQFVWSEVAAAVDNMLLTRQVSLIESELQNKLNEFDRQLAEMQTQSLGLDESLNAENQQIVNEMDLLGTELTRIVTEITEMAQDKRWARAQATRHTELTSFQRRFDDSLFHLSTNIQEEANQLAAQAVQVQQVSQFLWIVLTALAVGVGVVASVVALRSITRPVNILTGQAQRVTQRDFSPVEPLQQADEIGNLSRTFALMTDWLRESYQTLEDRVQERTRRLEIVALLAERFGVTRAIDEALQDTVDQIQENFNYYHAHIYVFDEQKSALTVAAGTGPAGMEMKARGHSIGLDAASLVARAARNRKIVWEDDVQRSSDWLPNPLLPKTRSEMAVPIVLEGNIVAGVLDVQQDTVAGLDEADANLLRLVASQIAASIRNSRLFSEVETALTEAREAQARYTQQAWDKSKMVEWGGQHLYVRANSRLTLEERQQTILEAGAQIQQHDHPTLITHQAGESMSKQTMVAPIKLRDTHLGGLQLHAPERPWDEDDMAIVQTVLDQFAQTAETLRLFEETRERAGLEQTIREVTDKLRASSNLDTLLETAARELGSRLGVRHTVLELGIDSPPDQLGNGQDASN